MPYSRLQTSNKGVLGNKQYDLEDRTLSFARSCRDLTKLISKNTANFEYSKQLIRSSGSVGANYIEANESLSKKDFVLRVKISRKEAKESRYWLSLIETADYATDAKRNKLISEATELIKILDSIARKSQ